MQSRSLILYLTRLFPLKYIELRNLETFVLIPHLLKDERWSFLCRIFSISMKKNLEGFLSKKMKMFIINIDTDYGRTQVSVLCLRPSSLHPKTYLNLAHLYYFFICKYMHLAWHRYCGEEFHFCFSRKREA